MLLIAAHRQELIKWGSGSSIHYQQTVRLVLEQAGYDVLLAHDGQEAVVALLAQSDNADRINTVLCDLDMPNMKGSELTSHLHAQYPNIPIVVLSGAADTDYLDTIIRQGVSGLATQTSYKCHASRKDQNCCAAQWIT